MPSAGRSSKGWTGIFPGKINPEPLTPPPARIMLEENPDNTAPPDTVSPPPDHGPSGTLPPGADAHATPPGAGADVDIWLQRVRNLCLNAPGMIYQFQYFPDGRSCFPYASDSIRSIYEVEPAQVLHDAGPVLARVHPEDFDRVLETIRRSAETGEVWEDEYRVRLPERGLRWLWGKAQPEAQPDGSVTWHGYITDVTDRRAAQEALEVSRHRLNQLTESLKEVVWLRSADRRGMLYVNPAYERIWGRSCQSLNENPSSFLDAVHPEDKEAVAEGFRSYLETGRFQMEYRIIRPDGSVRWVEAESYPTDVGPDGVPGNVGRAVDISERRATNDALRESEERFRLISKYTSDPIVVVDGNFILVHVSTAHERVFGYGPAEFQGLPLDEAMRFVHPEDVDAVRRAVFEAIGRRESGAVYSFRFRTKDGRWIWREDSSSLLYDDQGRFRGAYVIARDLTAQKEQEEALRAAKDAAERANQAKTDFLANMSHELRTPLNGVIGFTDLLRDTPLSPIQSQYVSSIHTAGRALLDIINNVLDLSKIEAGKLELDPSHTDIIALAGGGGRHREVPGLQEEPGLPPPNPPLRAPIRRGGCSPPQADPHEPAGERRQVHLRRDGGDVGDLHGWGRREEGEPPVHGEGHGDGDQPGAARPALQGFLPGRCLRDQAVWGHRSGSGDLEPARGEDGKPDPGGERGRKGQHLLARVPGGGRGRRCYGPN